VIARANERATFDMAEAEVVTVLLEGGEIFDGDVADDGQMLQRGAEVLAEGDNVNLVSAEGLHGFADFGKSFAKAEHESAFGGDLGAALFGVSEHFKAAFKACAETDLFVEAGDGFGVVVEDVGGGVENDVHGGVGALEIGNEDFHATAGDAFADGTDGGGEDASTAIGLIVTVDAGDDGKLEAHAGDGFGDPAGFIVINREWCPFLHGAEAAAAGAEVAKDHEGGSAAIPAVADVGAGGTFADCMEIEIGDELFEIAVIVADRGGSFEPLRAFGFGGLDRY